MHSDVGKDRYVLGESDDELRRLERQAAYFRLETEEGLRQAGVTAGMRVLDAGCGVGDVTQIAAGLVGPGGQVLGVDRVAAALDVARMRAAAGGWANVRFEQAELETYDGRGLFDAIVGRFVLLHSPDASRLMQILKRNLSPKGTMVFMELDISSMKVVPSTPLFDRCLQWIVEVYHRGGYEPDMGSRLYATFKAVDMEPKLTCTCRIEGAFNATGYEFLAQSIKSLMPSMIALDVASAADIEVETLAQRLQDEVSATDRCIIHPRFICGWATIA